ncbi:hypothetical protein COCNU_scaffold009866G000020 [Cocos nucifera]|nr:hypothetical protein [Cocos nucifera]
MSWWSIAACGGVSTGGWSGGCGCRNGIESSGARACNGESARGARIRRWSAWIRRSCSGARSVAVHGNRRPARWRKASSLFHPTCSDLAMVAWADDGQRLAIDYSLVWSERRGRSHSADLAEALGSDGHAGRRWSSAVMAAGDRVFDSILDGMNIEGAPAVAIRWWQCLDPVATPRSSDRVDG